MKNIDKEYKHTIMEIVRDQHHEITEGLLYTHTRINSNTAKTLEAASFLYALIEILSEKGMLSIQELDERKKQVAERLVKKFVESGLGLLYQDPLSFLWSKDRC